MRYDSDEIFTGTKADGYQEFWRQEFAESANHPVALLYYGVLIGMLLHKLRCILLSKRGKE